jgi:HSP20 family protein
MAIIRFIDRPNIRNPWAEFDRLRRSLDQFSQNYTNDDTRYGRTTVFPPLNIYEEKEHLVIKAEIPGVKSEDLDISVEGETLTLKGTRKQHSEDDKQSFHRREIERGTFSRAISLPIKVDPDNVSATLKNGILTVIIGKATEIKPRQVKILSE